jgi:Protein of unknown function (DUF1573)
MGRFIIWANICLVGLLTNLAVFTLLPGGSRSNCDASVFLPVQRIDLGIISPFENRDVRFEVMNHGKRRLVINKLPSGCGCCEPDDTVCVSPGETVDVMIRLETRSESGVFEKVTTFTSNDPNQPQFDLIIRASVAK